MLTCGVLGAVDSIRCRGIRLGSAVRFDGCSLHGHAAFFALVYSACEMQYFVLHCRALLSAAILVS